MNRALSSIDRWGPATVSLLTLFLLAIFGWWYSAKVARLEGQLETLQNQVNQQVERENGLRTETSALRAWSIAVHERGSAAGWKLPDLPLVPVEKEGTNPNKKKGD